MKEDPEEALVFQDEMEIHRHPTLARMWGPVGQQPEVPAPGKNEKRVVYGGVDYNSSKITYTVAKTKSGQNFLAFLITLVTAYAGRKVRLVCDNGRFHQTKAVLQWLRTHRAHIQVFWLPLYCPSLSMIERLTAVRSYQAYGIGQCVVCHDGRFGRRISPRRRPHQWPSK